MKKIRSFIAFLLCLTMFSSQIVFAAGLNLNLTLNENATLKVTWSSYPGAKKYSLAVYDDFAKCYVNQQNLTTTSYTTPQLPENKKYTFVLSAHDSDGIISTTETVTILIPYGIYAFIPLYIYATSTPNSITISWDPVSNATGYEVNFNGTTYSTTDTSRTFSGLTPQKSYTYALCSKNAAGKSAYTATKTILTLAVGTVLPVPTNVTATSAQTSVTVSWDAVPGATSYDVYFGGDTYTTANTSMTFRNLELGKTYSYKVQAKNSSGVSAYSGSRSIRLVPDIPSNISATSTLSSVKVSWEAVTGATSYDVDFNGTIYNTTDTYKTISGLKSDTIYTYAVSAKNSGGSGDYSTLRSISTKLPVPTNVNATSTKNSVTVTWDPVPGATSYYVNFNGTVYSVTGTSKTFTGLQSGTSYTYAVSAKNSATSSSYSSTKSISTKLSTPTNVRATSAENSVKVSWDASTGATGYNVNFNGTVYSTTNTTRTFSGLQSGTSYPYAVQAKSSTDLSEYSATKSIPTLQSPLPVPSVPSNVRATSTTNSATVSWDEVSGASSYDVNFNNKTYSTTSNSRTFTGLQSKTSYPFSVRSNNSTGSSAYSPTKSTSTTSSNKADKAYKKGTNYSNSKSKNYLDGKKTYSALDPVSAIEGAFLWSYECLNVYGKDSMDFTAMYNSQSDYNGVLGNKWTHSLNYTLEVDGDFACFITPDGEIIPFICDSGNIFQPADSMRTDYVMGFNSDKELYYVRNVDGTEYLFNKNLCLEKIVEAGVDTYTFQADSKGQIIKITGKYGASFNLSYTSGHISSVSDDTGNAVKFYYSGNSLIKSTNPDEDSILFAYDGNDNLTKITDFSGIAYLTNTYDLDGRVVKQDIAERGEAYVSYDEENRVNQFTDELGNKISYSYDENWNVTKIEHANGVIENKYNSNSQMIEQTDALGNTTKMEYDDIGRLIRIEYPDGTDEEISYNLNNYPVSFVNRDGTKTIYSYDLRNNLTSVTDERGFTERFEYDGQDNLVFYTDKNGDVSVYTYDDNGFLETFTDPEGNQYKYSFDKTGQLLSIVSPSGMTESYEYSAAGNLLQVIEQDGTTSYTYDSNGYNTGVTDKMGNMQYFEYDDMGQLTAESDFMGNKITYLYDQVGNLIKETDPLNYSQAYSYDALGNAVKMVDKNGNITENFFNSDSQLTETKNALGHSVKFSYDKTGELQVFTDANGNQTKYAYDKMGRVTAITNALGYTQSYTYDEIGNLLTETDENGAVTRYTYDNEGSVKSVITEFETEYFTYNKNGDLVSAKDDDGHSETFAHDSEGNIISASDKENNITKYNYDAFGRLSEVIDPIGNKTIYEYDKNDNCVKVIDANNAEYSYEYDANDRLTKITDPLNYSTMIEYNSRGDITSITDPKGNITAYEYDGNGNIIKSVNSLGGVIEQTFDPLDQLISFRDENNFISSYSYDKNGNVTTYTDPNGNEWRYEYDAIDRLIGISDKDEGKIALAYDKTDNIIKITDQEGAVTYYTYDSEGRVTEIKDALGNSLKQKYDSHGRVIQQTDPKGGITEYEYTPNGDLKSIKDPEGGVTSYTYNALGWLITETDPKGGVIRYEYDALGEIVSKADAMGNATLFTYNLNGQIETVKEANGALTKYSYDGNGNLVQVTDANGVSTYYEYDALNNQIKESRGSGENQTAVTLYQYDKKGQLIKEINPLKSEKAYSYDGNGNVIKVKDEDMNETIFVYDLNSNPTEIRYADGKEVIYRYNKRGELVEFKDWNGVTTLKHDQLGQLTSVTDHNKLTTSYTYDKNGSKASIIYPDNSTVKYTYDANDRITSVVDGENQTTEFEYDGNGNTTKILQPNGNITAYSYNANNLPVNITYMLNDGSQLADNLTYDALGNVISSIKTGNNPEDTKAKTYAYDKLNQLISFTEDNTVTAYAYDNNGNITTKSLNGRVDTSYKYNGFNQLVSRTENGTEFSYSYDNRGNLISEGINGSAAKTYVYNAANHMVEGKNLITGEQSQYTYNGLDMRIRLAQTLQNPDGGYYNKDISYAIDYTSPENNDIMLLEKDGYYTSITYGRGTERLSQFTKPLSEFNNPGTASSELLGKIYFQNDILGNIILISNSDGLNIKDMERDPWGNISAPVPYDMNLAGLENCNNFTNYSYDPVIEKYFAQARFYDPATGRMVSVDPINNGINSYTYCDNNPVNYVDPTGEVSMLAGALVGGILGGAIGFAGSIISQKLNGEEVNIKKAVGAAAKGAITGAVTGALIGSGAGVLALFAAGTGAGFLGSVAEQLIVSRQVYVRQAVKEGISNGISTAAYGAKPIKGLANAAARGARAGGASAAASNLYKQSSNKRNSAVKKAKSSGRSTSKKSKSKVLYDPIYWFPISEPNGSKSKSTQRSNGSSRSRSRKKSSYSKNTSAKRYVNSKARNKASRGVSAGINNFMKPKTKLKACEINFNFGYFASDVIKGAAGGAVWSSAFYGSGRVFTRAMSNNVFKSAGIKTYNKGNSSLKINLQFFEKKGNPNGIFKNAPYHGKTSNSVKSKAPINGQTALDHSVSISPNTTRRVGISNGEFVVLDKTQNGVFHGHVRAWNELTQQMQKALRKAGLVNAKGRIL